MPKPYDCGDRMCGADDCETCHPGCRDPVICGDCGDEQEKWRTGNCRACGKPLCDACLAVDSLCVACLLTGDGADEEDEP